MNATLRLKGLDNKRGVLFAHECLLQCGNIVEGHSVGIRQQRAESLSPKCVIHERERARGQSMETAFRINNTGAAGGGSRKLDGRLHALAATAAKADFFQAPSSQITKAPRQETGDVT